MICRMAFICSCRLSVRAARSASTRFAELRQHDVFETSRSSPRPLRGWRSRPRCRRDRQHAAPHGAEAAADRRRDASSRPRPSSAVRKSAWPLRMPKLPLSSSARTATTSAIVDDDDGRRGDQQPHDGSLSPVARQLLSRAPRRWCRPCRASSPPISSQSPSRIARQPLSVSASGTERPGLPVKASVTANGWVRKRCSRRARCDDRADPARSAPRCPAAR